MKNHESYSNNKFINSQNSKNFKQDIDFIMTNVLFDLSGNIETMKKNILESFRSSLQSSLISFLQEIHLQNYNSLEKLFYNTPNVSLELEYLTQQDRDVLFKILGKISTHMLQRLIS